MSIDDQELRAITFLVMRVRRATQGAGVWDETGVMANLRKIANRNLHMTIEHALRHAADPAAKSPGVIAGNFTPEAPKPTPKVHPPKKSEECATHPGQYPPPYCGPCATESTDAYYDPKETTMPTTVTTGAAGVREQLQRAGDAS